MSRTKPSKRTRAGTGDETPPSAPAWPTGSWASWIAMLALAVYAAAFFAGRLPSMPTRADGTIWRRVHFFDWLLIPDELVSLWIDHVTLDGLVARAGIALLAIAILAVAGIMGAQVLRLVGACRRLTRLEQVVFSLAVGLSVISLYTLAVGLVGLLRYRLVFIVPGFLVFGAGAWRWYVSSQVRHDTLSEGVDHDDIAVSDALPWRVWRWLAAPLVVAIVLGGMMPPVEFDVREYHLQAPKEFYESGRVHFLADNAYGNMPLGSEMLALAAMGTLGDWWYGALVGKLLIATFAILTAVDLWALGRRYASACAGTVAAIAYLSTPWILRESMLGLIECAVGFFTITAIHALLIWREETETSDVGLLSVAGFLAGSAVACKYPALLMTVVPLTLFVVAVARRRALALAVFVASVTLACGLWFAKNYAFTGDPTYPLLANVFDTVGRTPAQIAQWQAAHLPHEFAVSDALERIARVLLQSQWLGLLTVPLAVAGAVLAWRERWVRLAVAYLAFVLLAWWLATHRLDRFLVPVLPVVAFLAGASVGRLARLVGRHVLSALFAAACLYALLVAVSGPAGDNRFFAGLEYMRTDPQRVTPWRLYLNEHARDGRAVLSLGDAEVFDFEVPVTYHTTFDTCPLEALYESLSGDDLYRAIRQRYSYIYVNWSEIKRYRSPGNYGYTDFVQPELFDALQAAGVLDRRIDEFADSGVMIYHVAPPEKQKDK